MKCSPWLVTVGFSLFAWCQSVPGQGRVEVQLKTSGSQAEVGVDSQLELPVSAMYPEYVIQQSSNLVTWATVAGPFAGGVGVSDEFLRVAVPTGGGHSRRVLPW